MGKSYGKKLIELSVFLIVLSCSENSKGINYNNLEESISLQKVIESSNLSDGSVVHALELKFYKNGTYEFYYSSEGWDWRTEGSYSIKNNKVLLQANPCSSNISDFQCKNAFNYGLCSIEENKNSIEYKFKFVCVSKEKFIIFSEGSEPSNTISFDIKEYKLPTGTKTKHQNYEIVTLGNTQGKVKEPVVLRGGPGIEFPKVDYVVNVYDGPVFSSLPTGTIVTIHART